MYILGINFSSHDTSACLVRDGELLGFIEEERFNRIKHTSEFPARAIAYLLKQEGISQDKIDYVAIPTTQNMPLGILLRLSFSFGWRGIMSIIMMNLKYRFKYLRTLQKFKQRIRNSPTKIVFVEHHTAHLANAFFLSPFQKAAVLSVDNNGDGLSSRLAYGEGNRLKFIDSLKLPHSIGLLYYIITQYLGFTEESGEGKVMGLASYGNPDRFIDVFRDIVQLKPGGSYTINTKYFIAKSSGIFGHAVNVSDLFIRQCGQPRRSGEPFTKEHEDIAAGLQKITEETVVHVLNYLYNKTKCENLALSGGVVLNSVMNGMLHRKTPFKNIFVQPLAYDGGNAVGAAFYVWNVVLGRSRRYQLSSCYLGPEFSSDTVRGTLEEMKLNYEILENPSKRAAELIAEGKIIGWFQGRMEAGARALGNRSILADPRVPEMKDIVNKHVKHREPFRPFAPAILENNLSEYFEDSVPVPFMEKVFTIRPERRHMIPAVTHVDGTGRLQTVNKQGNPRFFDLITEFNRITGVPVVLNTSFNIKGEPIVCSPADAIRCFYSTGIDFLIIDRFLLKK